MGKNEINIYSSSATSELQYSGVDPGFQVRGAHLKRLRRAEGGAKIFGDNVCLVHWQQRYNYT